MAASGKEYKEYKIKWRTKTIIGTPITNAWRRAKVVIPIWSDSEKSELIPLARNAWTLASTRAKKFTVTIEAKNAMWDVPMDWQYPCDSFNAFGSVLTHTSGSTMLQATNKDQLIVSRITKGKITSFSFTIIVLIARDARNILFILQILEKSAANVVVNPSDSSYPFLMK